MRTNRTFWAHYGNTNASAKYGIIQKINLFKFCKYLKFGGIQKHYSVSSSSVREGAGPIVLPCLCNSMRAFLSPSGPMSSKSYILDS